MAEAGHLLTARNINSISSSFNKAALKSATQTFKIKASSKRNDISLVKHHLLFLSDFCIFPFSITLPFRLSSFQQFPFHFKIWISLSSFWLLLCSVSVSKNYLSSYMIQFSFQLKAWINLSHFLVAFISLFQWREEAARLHGVWSQYRHREADGRGSGPVITCFPCKT